MAKPKTPIDVAFHQRYAIDLDTGCWNWTGAFDKDGYGQWQTQKIRQPNGKYLRTRLRAPRISWELFKGPIPKDRYILHTCDNPKCVNPEHLILGTAKQNSEDMVRKGRAAFGGKQGNAKLTDISVTEIRQSGETLEVLSERYGVSVGTIDDARSGRTWKHLPLGAANKFGDNRRRDRDGSSLSNDDIVSIGHRLSEKEPYDVIANDFGVSNLVIKLIDRVSTLIMKGEKGLLDRSLQALMLADASFDLLCNPVGSDLTNAQVASTVNTVREEIKDIIE